MSVKKIRRARLPLKKNQEIDLIKLFNELGHTSFETSYEPLQGLPGLLVKVPCRPVLTFCKKPVNPRISFYVFRKGTLTIYGMLPNSEIEDIINSFWKNYFKKCVVNI